MSKFLDIITSKTGTIKGKKYEHSISTLTPTEDVPGIKSFEFKGDSVSVTSTIFDPVDTMTAFNHAAVEKRVGLFLLKSDVASIDNTDGTYVHTFRYEMMRYITKDPRITHAHDDRQAGPV